MLAGGVMLASGGAPNEKPSWAGSIRNWRGILPNFSPVWASASPRFMSVNGMPTSNAASDKSPVRKQLTSIRNTAICVVDIVAIVPSAVSMTARLAAVPIVSGKSKLMSCDALSRNCVIRWDAVIAVLLARDATDVMTDANAFSSSAAFVSSRPVTKSVVPDRPRDTRA